MNELTKPEPRSLSKKPDTMPQTPIQLMASLLERPNLSSEGVAALGELVKLKEHMEDREAKRDFAAAFSAMQAGLPAIKATKEVPNNDGTVRYAFAPFESIMRELKPHLDKHGFAVRFSTEYTKEVPFRVIVYCTLMHASGHSETNHFAARIGDGPPKSSQAQGDGAAATYAKRFALCQAVNIVIEGMDDDARSHGNTLVTEEQAEEIQKLYDSLIQQKVIVKSETREWWWKFFGAAEGLFNEIPAANYARIMDAMRKKIPT